MTATVDPSALPCPHEASAPMTYSCCWEYFQSLVPDITTSTPGRILQCPRCQSIWQWCGKLGTRNTMMLLTTDGLDAPDTPFPMADC